MAEKMCPKKLRFHNLLQEACNNKHSLLNSLSNKKEPRINMLTNE